VTLGKRWSGKLPTTAPIDKKVSTLIVCLEYGDAVARTNAIAALVKMGLKAAPAVPALAKALDDADAEVRRGAIELLGSLRSASAPAADALAKRLTDDEPKLRWLAADALAKIGPGAAPAVDALTKALKDDNPTVRKFSARALGAIGAGAASAAPALAEALKDDDANARLAAAVACVKVGAPAPAVPVLAAFLTGGSPRLPAAQALAAVGPAARPASGALVKALKARNEKVREHSALALGAIGPGAAEAVGALAVALRDEQINVRVAAATALGRMGPAAAKAIPQLVRALRKGQNRVRVAAAEALKALGPKAAPAAADLVEALMDNHAPVGQVAADALVAIGKPAIPHLNKRVKGDDGQINMPVIRVLDRIASPAPASGRVPRPAASADRLAIAGEYKVRCASTWHNINLTFKVGGQVALSAAEARGLIPSDRGNRQCVVSDELTQALGIRLLKSMRLTCDDAQAAARWLGTGRKNETWKASGRLKAVLLRTERLAPNRVSVVRLTGQLTLAESCRLASRYGPNTHMAVWTLAVNGLLTFDASTGRMSGVINVNGSIAGGYGAGEPYTATVRLVLKPAASASARAPAARLDTSDAGHASPKKGPDVAPKIPPLRMFRN